MAKKRRKTAKTASKSRKASKQKNVDEENRQAIGQAQRKADGEARARTAAQSGTRRRAASQLHRVRAPAAAQPQPASLDDNMEQTLPLDDVQLPS